MSLGKTIATLGLTRRTPARTPPSPRHYSFGLVNFFRIWKRPLAFYQWLLTNYGDFCTFRLETVRCYFVNRPELIHEVLTQTGKQYRKSDRHMRILRQGIGNGLVTSDGKLWSSQRRKIQPIFLPSNITAYAEDMVRYARETITGWQPGEEIEMLDEMTRLTLRIAGKSLLNVDLLKDARALGEAVRFASDTFAMEMRPCSVFPIGSRCLTNVASDTLSIRYKIPFSKSFKSAERTRGLVATCCQCYSPPSTPRMTRLG